MIMNVAGFEAGSARNFYNFKCHIVRLCYSKLTQMDNILIPVNNDFLTLNEINVNEENPDGKKNIDQSLPMQIQEDNLLALFFLVYDLLTT